MLENIIIGIVSGLVSGLYSGLVVMRLAEFRTLKNELMKTLCFCKLSFMNKNFEYFDEQLLYQVFSGFRYLNHHEAAHVAMEIFNEVVSSRDKKQKILEEQSRGIRQSTDLYMQDVAKEQEKWLDKAQEIHPNIITLIGARDIYNFFFKSQLK